MSHKVKILIFPAGEINSVELHQALCSNVNIELYGASSVDRHGAYLFKRYISGLPLITEDNFLSKFNQVLESNQIDFVFSTHDDIVLFLMQHEKNIKAKIIAANLRTCEICRDKKMTYDLFAEEDFCPQVYETIDQFPIFVKPRKGQGAMGAQIIRTFQDVKIDNLSSYIITEYLPGQEMTVDCLTDAHGILKTVLPRTRERTLGGVSTAGTAITASEEILHIAEKINSKLEFMGLWYFQVKQDKAGRYKLLEISTRCAGSMCLSRARGVNLPLLSVYISMGKEVDVFENDYLVKMDRTLISRYKMDYHYDTVYFDYDDTLIVEEKICLPAIQFLYQCVNEGKKVILISRHEMDHNNSLLQDLEKNHISKSLFTQIICLTEKQEKVDYITNRDTSIFIDNAYSERKKIHEKLKIPVFDVEGLEVLLHAMN